MMRVLVKSEGVFVYNTPFTSKNANLSQSVDRDSVCTNARLMPHMRTQDAVFFLLFKRTVLTKSGEPCLLIPTEIYNLFKYTLAYVDDNKWLVNAVLMSLQNDPSIFFCASESYREYRLNGQHDKRAIGTPHDFGGFWTRSESPSKHVMVVFRFKMFLLIS